MAKIIVIVDNLCNWNSYYPVEQLMTPQDYLVNWDESLYGAELSRERIKVINLCDSHRYLSAGYYCSLLAEARGHSVIPTINTINDLSKSSLYHLQTEDLEAALEKAFKGQSISEGLSFSIYFGKTDKEQLQEVARQIFDLFPAPILIVDIEWDKKWKVHAIRTGNLPALSSHDEDKFALSLDEYAGKIWRRPKAKKKFRYDLAILHNPFENMPPSDKKALKKFIRAGKELDVQVELIEKKDFPRLAEFDALFIRETTALNHHTYRFARKAESEGLISIDDSLSILRCTNKIYMHNILTTNNICAPKTKVIANSPEQLENVITEIGFPMIIKIPDGSFSKGVFKVRDKNELSAITEVLFKKSALLLVQEFFYTDFDWRIGVMNNRPIFACKYYMTKGHWQIYDHNKKGKIRASSGASETLPLSKVPRHILSAALKLSHQVGDSLYGVDLKEKDGKAFVIEINDNPNIDNNIEDAILGMDLYHHIIHDFVKRIEEKGA